MPEFSLRTRDTALDRMGSVEFDMAVVGGGITGAGVALDAATRGLKVALVDKGDFASGTSSRSSRLIHGGIRYLEHGELGLVYEALSERQRLLKMAPHLVRPLSFIMPTFSGGGRRAALMRRAVPAGLHFYDITGGARIGMRHHRLGSLDVALAAPTVDFPGIDAAYLYWDAHADDARLTLAVVKTAATFGAHAVNYCAVEAIDGRSGTGFVLGCRDALGGAAIEIRASSVVNAAGVWVDRVRALDEGTAPGSVRPAKGIHIVLPRELLWSDSALLLPAGQDGRFVFAIPWGPTTIIGTTDTDYDGPLDDPRPEEAEISYVLDAVNRWSTLPVERTDVISAYAGLRPLVVGAASARTADLSRRHRVQISRSGVATTSGGKLTTWRLMASDTVKAVASQVLGISVGRCRTRDLVLDGASGWERGRRHSGRSSLSQAALDHLSARHGGNAAAVAAMAESGGRDAPLVEGLPYIEAEVAYAARYEMAAKVEDVLARRTRAETETPDAGAGAAARVADLIGAELGWSRAQKMAAADEYAPAVALPRGPAARSRSAGAPGSGRAGRR